MKIRRLQLLAVPLLVAAMLGACSRSSSNAPSTSVLPRRSLDAGAVKVVITPTRFDAIGATFSISLDTHSADLSVDLAAATVLDVGGTAWAVKGWSGTAPGGHHRSGELSFTAQGPPKGTVHLTISGLPEPVDTTWQL